jgi:hypothetical protein
MAQCLARHFHDPAVDVGQDGLGAGLERGPVPDDRPGVADEIGQRRYAPPVQDIGSFPGVGDVGSGRDDPDRGRERLGGPAADHPRPGAGDKDIRLHRGEEHCGRARRRAVVSDAIITVKAAQRQQPLDVEPRRVRDASGDGGHGGNPAAPPHDLSGHPATHLAEPFDGN